MNLFDLFAVAVIALFAYFGYRKGFLMSVASLAGLVLAIIGSNLFAGKVAAMLQKSGFTEFIQGKVSEYVSLQVDKMIPATGTAGAGALTDAQMVENLNNSASFNLFDKLGSFDLEAQIVKFGNALGDGVDTAIQGLKQSLTSDITPAVINALAYLITFLLICLLVTIVLRLIKATIGTIPPLEQLDKAGGLLLNGVKGALIVVVVIIFSGVLTLAIPSLEGWIASSTTFRIYGLLLAGIFHIPIS